MIFKFRLQSVLEYRAFLENVKKMELAEKQRVYLYEKGRGERLRDIRNQYHEALRQETSNRDLSVTMLTFYQSYLFVVESQIEVQDKKTEGARLEMVKAQEALVEARKMREVMDRAKEKAHKDYLKEEEYQNQKMLDEISAIKFVRSRNGLNMTAQAVSV